MFRITSSSERNRPAALRGSADALPLGLVDGPRRLVAVVECGRRDPAVLVRDRGRRYRHRRHLRAGLAEPPALADPPARRLCRGITLHAAAGADRLVLLRAANTAEFQ